MDREKGVESVGISCGESSWEEVIGACGVGVDTKFPLSSNYSWWGERSATPPYKIQFQTPNPKKINNGHLYCFLFSSTFFYLSFTARFYRYRMVDMVVKADNSFPSRFLWAEVELQLLGFVRMGILVIYDCHAFEWVCFELWEVRKLFAFPWVKMQAKLKPLEKNCFPNNDIIIIIIIIIKKNNVILIFNLLKKEVHYFLMFHIY